MISYADAVRGMSQNIEEEKDNNQDSEPLYRDPECKFQCGQIAERKFVGQVTVPYNGKLTLYNSKGKKIAQIKTSCLRGVVYVNRVDVDRDYQGMRIASYLVSSLSYQGISMVALCYYSSFSLFKRLGFLNMDTERPVYRGLGGRYSFIGTRKMVLRGKDLCMHQKLSCENKLCK